MTLPSASTKSYWRNRFPAQGPKSQHFQLDLVHFFTQKSPTTKKTCPKTFLIESPIQSKSPWFFFQLYLRFQFTKNSTTNPLRTAAVTFSWGESVGRETTGATLKSRCRITRNHKNLPFWWAAFLWIDVVCFGGVIVWAWFMLCCLILLVAWCCCLFCLIKWYVWFIACFFR